MVSSKLLLIGLGLVVAIGLSFRRSSGDNFVSAVTPNLPTEIIQVSKESDEVMQIKQNIKHAESLFQSTVGSCSGKNDRRCLTARKAAGAITLTRSQADQLHGLRGQSVSNSSQGNISTINLALDFAQKQQNITVNNQTIADYIKIQRDQLSLLSV